MNVHIEMLTDSANERSFIGALLRVWRGNRRAELADNSANHPIQSSGVNQWVI
jgi:hypothetical protein